MELLALRRLAVDQVQESEPLLVAVALQAVGDHGAVERVQRGEHGGRAMTLVVVGHGLGPALLHGQSRLGAVEGLNLALLIKRRHKRVLGRIQIEADHVFQPLGEPGFVAWLERVEAMRLQAMRPPDAAHAGFADAGGRGRRGIRSGCQVCVEKALEPDCIGAAISEVRFLFPAFVASASLYPCRKVGALFGTLDPCIRRAHGHGILFF
jgi:hypothetical protein